MENYYENAMIAAEFRKSNEGKRLGGYLELLNKIASGLLNYHEEEICCSEYFSVGELPPGRAKRWNGKSIRVSQTGSLGPDHV